MKTLFISEKKRKIILMLSFKVNNFEEWTTGFEKNSHVREKAGIKVLNITKSIGHSNQLLVIEEAENLETATNFINLLRSNLSIQEKNKFTISLFEETI